MGERMTTFDRNNPDESIIDRYDNSVTIAGHKFSRFGNPLNDKATALRNRVLPYCNWVEHTGAILEHDGYRWQFDSRAMLDKAESLIASAGLE